MVGFYLRRETSHLSLKMIALANVDCRNGGGGSKVAASTEAGRPAGGLLGGDDSHLDLGQHRENKLLESRCDLKVDVTDFTKGLNVRMRKRKEPKIFGWGPNN